MSVPLTIDLPPDLAAKAAEIPGLLIRLRLFTRAEITQHEKRERRHSAEAKQIVREAIQMAEETKAAGFDREKVMARFMTNYESVVEKL